MKLKSLVVVSFNHPELFPPTLNAVGCLSNVFEDVTLVTTAQLKSTWSYPDNCSIVTVGDQMNLRDTISKSIWWKFYFFGKYTKAVLNSIKQNKPKWVLCYDPFSLLAYKVALYFTGLRPKLWYHNHDIIEKARAKLFSLSWFSLSAEKSMMGNMDIFSLPSIERRTFFEMNLLKGQFLLLPNYPSFQFFSQFKKENKLPLPVELRLIYQGRISGHHGLETIIILIGKKLLKARLLLCGLVNEDYKEALQKLAIKYNVENQIHWLGFVKYQDMPTKTNTANVGIGIYVDSSVMVSTVSTASNKIYEYAASGLPVLVFDNSHFRKYLGNYSWVNFTDLTETSLLQCIHDIRANYTMQSLQAYADFEEQLNFEKHFEKATQQIEYIG